MARKGGTPENLKPFKKGFDPRRNYEGAPPIVPELKDALTKYLLEEKDLPGIGKITGLDAVLKSLHAKAVKGDIRAIQEILDRFYGKPQQYIDHTTKGNEINRPRIIFANLNEDDEQ